jgi:hypothetical protein
MSKGIFQLAVMGRVLFRWSPETKSDLRDLDCMKIAELELRARNVPSSTAIYDSGYAERLL